MRVERDCREITAQSVSPPKRCRYCAVARRLFRPRFDTFNGCVGAFCTYIDVMNAREALTERLNLRLAESELLMLHDLSEETGLSMSDVLRQLIRREHKRVATKPNPKAKKGRRG